MKIALVLESDVIDDVWARDRLIESLRHKSGVLKLDDEMAENGLLLADLAASTDVTSFEKIKGIVGVRSLGTKRAIAG